MSSDSCTTQVADGTADGVIVEVMMNVCVCVAETVARGGGGYVAVNSTKDVSPHAEIRKKTMPRSVSAFSSF